MEQLTLFPLEDFTVELPPPPPPPAILAEMEGFMAQSVELLGVAAGAWSAVRTRWQGNQPTVPHSGYSQFLQDIAHFVAVAAVERGIPALAALDAGRAVCEKFRERYKGSQFYFPLVDTRMERYKAIMQDFNALGMDETVRKHRCSFQLILRVRRMANKRGRRLRAAV